MWGWIIAAACALIIIAVLLTTIMSGSGGVQRITTISGIYSVCKPDGYSAVCFANKSGGGFSCVPFSGECK